jgi:hypothetical protein
LHKSPSEILPASNLYDVDHAGGVEDAVEQKVAMVAVAESRIRHVSRDQMVDGEHRDADRNLSQSDRQAAGILGVGSGKLTQPPDRSELLGACEAS